MTRTFEDVRKEREAFFNLWRMRRGGSWARQAMDELMGIDEEYHEMIKRGEDHDSETEAVEEE